MDAFDWMAIGGLFLLLGAGLYGLIVLLELPGKYARERKMAYATAIRVAGWLGLLTGGLFWCIALVWSMMGSATERPRP
jgi:hypothetical protein